MYNLNYYMIIFYHANNACVLTIYVIYTLIFFPVMQTVYHPVNIAMRCCRTRPILGNVQVKIYENWLVIINDKAVIINELSTFWSNEKRLSLFMNSSRLLDSCNSIISNDNFLYSIQLEPSFCWYRFELVISPIRIVDIAY